MIVSIFRGLLLYSVLPVGTAVLIVFTFFSAANLLK